MLKRGYLIFITALFFLDTIGQTYNPHGTANIIPPSPEISALGKYIDMPVGYSTGIPQINIPLSTVSSVALDVPIGLNYNASGIKVEEVSTWVGLGWTLSCGPSLFRVVYGLPDDTGGKGYMYAETTVQDYLETPLVDRINLILNLMVPGALDTEPDMFCFSIMGYEGRFYYDQQEEKFVLAPEQNLKIETIFDGSIISGFKITLPNGVIGYFGMSEAMDRSAYDRFISSENYTITNAGSGDAPGNMSPHITAWKILEMIDPSGKSVKFDYTESDSRGFGRGGESKLFGAYCSALTDNDYNASYYYQNSSISVLEKISYDKGSITFKTADLARQDVIDSSKALDSIIIKNLDGKVTKSYSFDYGYFTSPAYTWPYFSNEFNEIARNRLYLKNITENNPGSNSSLPPYMFSYDSTIILPSRLSTAQDYWGYYNGKENNANLIPTIDGRLANHGTGYILGADRTIDLSYAKACVLNKIQYPTGGDVQYYYESNTAVNTINSSSGYQLSGLLDKYHTFSNSTLFQQPSNPNLYIDSFEIENTIQGDVKVLADFDCENFNSDECPVTAKIIGITDPGYLSIISSSEFYGTFSPGKYKIEALVQPPPNSPPVDFSVSLSWKINPDTNNNIIVGGLRTKRIVSCDATGGRLVKAFSYNFFDDTLRTSGRLLSNPAHFFDIYCGEGIEPVPAVLKTTSGSAVPLSNSDGRIIMYSNVTEYYDDNKSSFKTEYSLTYDFDYVEPGAENYPFPNNVKRNWRIGLMDYKKQYEKPDAGSPFRLVSYESYSYAFINTVYKNFGISIAPYPTPNTYGVTPYRFVTERFNLDSVYSEKYDYSASPYKVIKKAVKNYYNTNYALAYSQTRGSKGEVIHNKNWYPYDFDLNAGHNVNELISKNIVDVPLKQEKSVNGKLVKGTVTLHNQAGLPDSIYEYHSNTLNDTLEHDHSVVIPPNYELMAKFDYSSGNDLAQITNKGFSTSYIWGYNNTYPIAEFQNAPYDEVAYTGFEGEYMDSYEKWNEAGGAGFVLYDNQNAPEGKYCMGMHDNILTGAIESQGVTLNSQKKYILSFWEKGEPVEIMNNHTAVSDEILFTKGDWRYRKIVFTGISGSIQLTTSFAGDCFVDELGLYPLEAQMETYTYAPLVGMTSQCDINNRVTYYEYDGFGRLSLIRDMDNNILKKICYNYAGQQTNCDVNVVYVKVTAENINGSYDDMGVYVESADYYLRCYDFNGQPLTLTAPIDVSVDWEQQFLDWEGSILSSQTDHFIYTIGSGTNYLLFAPDVMINSILTDEDGNFLEYKAEAKIIPGSNYLIKAD